MKFHPARSSANRSSGPDSSALCTVLMKHIKHTPLSCNKQDNRSGFTWLKMILGREKGSREPFEKLKKIVNAAIRAGRPEHHKWLQWKPARQRRCPRPCPVSYSNPCITMQVIYYSHYTLPDDAFHTLRLTRKLGTRIMTYYARLEKWERH